MPCGLRFEKHLWSTGKRLLAGIDEAGRGPLAGPVVAAAAILPPRFSLRGLNDSKQLTETVRETFFEALTAPGKLICYAVGIAQPEEIDRLNILQASILAMQRAVADLAVRPEHLLIDGLPVRAFSSAQTAIVGGDQKSLSIAAASVIAKVTRDRIMKKWHGEYPQYSFDQNKGYGTRAHVASLQIHGPCPIHRRSFAPVAQPYLFAPEAFPSAIDD
ncbi:MAG TPA: ribonuclease HII [Chthoniobacterales bacterium]|jgi:ribonuclease HII|nr:ribonuclease HII [Chthoniobacterales bacterium]